MAADAFITNTTLVTSETTERTTFMNTLASEWLKLTTLRSTYVTLGLGALLSVAMSALPVLLLLVHRDEYQSPRHLLALRCIDRHHQAPFVDSIAE